MIRCTTFITRSCKSHVNTIHTRAYIDGDKRDEVVSNIGFEQVHSLSPLLLLQCKLLKKHMDEIDGASLNGILIWWSPYFFMLTMWFCSLNHKHTYKDL